MQPGIKNDLVYLLIILQSIEKIRLYSEKFNSANEFYHYENQMAFDACLLLLSNIGEQSSKVSLDTINKYREVPWKKTKQVRNRITHDYTGVDFEIMYSIIRNDLPQLRANIIYIIKTELQDKNFSREEYDLAKSSEFYKYINFNEII